MISLCLKNLPQRIGAVFIRPFRSLYKEQVHTVYEVGHGHDEGQSPAVNRLQHEGKGQVQKIQAAEEGALPQIMSPPDRKGKGSHIEGQLEYKEHQQPHKE